MEKHKNLINIWKKYVIIKCKIELLYLFVITSKHKMNTPEYRKAYLASLQQQISNNNKNLIANKGHPAAQQYIQNTGQPILGVTTIQKSNTKGNKSKEK